MLGRTSQNLHEKGVERPRKRQNRLLHLKNQKLLLMRRRLKMMKPVLSLVLIAIVIVTMMTKNNFKVMVMRMKQMHSTLLKTTLMMMTTTTTLVTKMPYLKMEKPQPGPILPNLRLLKPKIMILVTKMMTVGRRQEVQLSNNQLWIKNGNRGKRRYFKRKRPRRKRVLQKLLKRTENCKHSGRPRKKKKLASVIRRKKKKKSEHKK
mmetsp:Transcript_6747/g.8543  ORF Transcript_6747/g.8543 Transcript_6747/m.8543 type:complete len:206 (+) Transcript_6747:3544-4161(+)